MKEGQSREHLYIQEGADTPFQTCPRMCNPSHVAGWLPNVGVTKPGKTVQESAYSVCSSSSSRHIVSFFPRSYQA